MKEIKVQADLAYCGIRQDRIRRFLHSNELGVIHSFTEDELDYSMCLFVKNAHTTVVDFLKEEFPMYTFTITD